MSQKHELETIDEWIVGDSKLLKLTLLGDDGNPITSISTSQIEWRVTHSRGDSEDDAFIDESNQDVSITVENATEGRVDIFISEDNSIPAGTHWQYIVYDPSNDSRQTWVGKVELDS